MMSTDRSNRGSDHPVMSSSFELVAMITQAHPRTSSGPAATAPRTQAGHMTAPDPTVSFSLAPHGPSTHDCGVVISLTVVGLTLPRAPSPP